MARSLMNCLSIFDCEPLAVVRSVSYLPLLQSFQAVLFVNKFFFFFFKHFEFLSYLGGFQLEFVSISWVINHITCYNFKCLIGGKFD